MPLPAQPSVPATGGASRHSLDERGTQIRRNTGRVKGLAFTRRGGAQIAFQKQKDKAADKLLKGNE